MGSGDAARLQLFGTTRNEWLVGPRFVAQPGTQLSYSIAMTDVGSANPDAGGGMQGTDDHVDVMISLDCGVSYTPLFVHNAGNTVGLTNVLSPQLIDLTPYAGQQVIIAFRGSDGPIR